ncbi:MAG: helix-turn-helix transcriptional regulator [Chloroflexi bacterium]|nr:helix-turn-helix transcriptional regulator [Chloroflexota bacterium]
MPSAPTGEREDAGAGEVDPRVAAARIEEPALRRRRAGRGADKAGVRNAGLGQAVPHPPVVLHHRALVGHRHIVVGRTRHNRGVPARVNPEVPGESLLARRLGRRIRALRQAKGLTMAELGSTKRGVVYFQRQHVWKMETGRVTPTVAALAHFAKRLDLRLAELVEDVDLR